MSFSFSFSFFCDVIITLFFFLDAKLQPDPNGSNKFYVFPVWCFGHHSEFATNREIVSESVANQLIMMTLTHFFEDNLVVRRLMYIFATNNKPSDSMPRQEYFLLAAQAAETFPMEETTRNKNQ
ncbi:MAG: hypothetical protein J6I61_10625 [Prevotella sp.]|nr:hypothetical protein [Prevotella sp.]